MCIDWLVSKHSQLDTTKSVLSGLMVLHNCFYSYKLTNSAKNLICYFAIDRLNNYGTN